MQYHLNDPSHRTGSENTITMEHKGQTLVWNINTYRKLAVTNELVTDINHYWKMLSEEDQDSIWGIYNEIHTYFETIENTRKLDELLLTSVAKLFEYHKEENIMYYFSKYARIKMPNDLKDEYVVGLAHELTYLRPEYYQLIGLAIVLKIMIPIWGGYVSIVGSEVGSIMKEYRAAALLKGSNVVFSNGYTRLMKYVTTYWEGYTQQHSSAAIVAGLDSNQVPNWLLGNALFRRVASAPLIQLDSPETPQPVIAAVYNYINSLIDTMDKQFGGRINEKNLENSPGDDDNTSVVENYKIKQEIPEGTIVTHEVHLKHHYLKILKRLDETITEAELAQFAEFNKVTESVLLEGFLPTQLSKAICMWVLDPIVTAKILEYVDYQSLRIAHAITYWLLQRWGYPELALLVFAKQVNSTSINNVVKQQASEEQLDQLNIIYPYAQNVTTKRKPSKRDSNVALAAIRYVVSGIYSSWWEIPAWENPDNYQGINNIRITNRRMGLPYDIEPRLADLIIKLKTSVHKGKYGTDSVSQNQPQ